MKFQTPLILLANLLTLVSAEAAGAGAAVEARSHPRDFVTEANHALRNIDISKRAAPATPAGQDDTKLQVWIRTDSRPTSYDDRSGAKHDGLNQLMKDTGGRHKDVVVGNSQGYYEYGLQFDSRDWQTLPNGDGADISEYSGDYEEVPNGAEEYEYIGPVKDGRKTLNSIKKVSRDEIKDKVYNHVSYNCQTYAQDLANTLVNGN